MSRLDAEPHTGRGSQTFPDAQRAGKVELRSQPSAIGRAGVLIVDVVAFLFAGLFLFAIAPVSLALAFVWLIDKVWGYDEDCSSGGW